MNSWPWALYSRLILNALIACSLLFAPVQAGGIATASESMLMAEADCKPKSSCCEKSKADCSDSAFCLIKCGGMANFASDGRKAAPATNGVVFALEAYSLVALSTPPPKRPPRI